MFDFLLHNSLIGNYSMEAPVEKSGLVMSILEDLRLFFKILQIETYIYYTDNNIKK